MSRTRHQTVDLVIWISDEVSIQVRCHGGDPNLRTLGELRALLRRWLAGHSLAKETNMPGRMIGLEEFGELTGKTLPDGSGPERRDPPWRLLEVDDGHGGEVLVIQRRAAVSRIAGEPDTWDTLSGRFATQDEAVARIREIIADEQMRPAGEG